MPAKTSKSLFSEHYLARRLPQHDEWRDANATAAFQTAVALYRAKADVLPTYNEAQTEQEFIQPLLEEVLGFDDAYTVQTTARRQGRVQRPDYALFPNAATKAEADRHLSDETAFYGRAVAVADAKYWQRPLSQKRAGDRRDTWANSNPSFQIVNYLVATGVDWGILTNGRFWRLYSRQVSGTATEFYEVDLLEIFAAPDDEKLDRFKRFWLFFRRAAFAPDARGQNFLDRVRAGSAGYARVVGDQLKDRVFDDIFPLLAGGLVADMAYQGADPTTADTRRLVYEATLSLLYKLLFLLYGEARQLLPVDNPGYRRESLSKIAQEVADLIDRDQPLGTTSTRLHKRLLALFELIDRGDRALGLPYYNGGLFHFDFRQEAARAKHPANYLITQFNVNDRRLAHALDLLARIDGEMIDYGYIGVRHLGAIYEGLLEYRLVVDDAAAGAVHLENDKGERKATGSYYTPDYIVKYIVSHTLGPILDERAGRFAELMDDITPKRQRLHRLDARLGERDLSNSVESRYKNEQLLLRRELNGLEQEARETLLDVKICDPAMGSGHFLVEVVDYLTTRLITILNDYPDDNPVLGYLGRIRASILENMTAQGITVDPERLDDTQLLQRVVMKRSIYGVDLNRMAVELAKVSLWLHTFTVGAPLSFLDHHLRWGNSLVGAMARDAAEEMDATLGQAGQLAMSFMAGPFAGLLRAAEIMRGISRLSDATLDEVEQSEALFREFDEKAEPYKKLLDVYVAQHFGVARADEFLRSYDVNVFKRLDQLKRPYRRALEESAALYQEHRFFHWDLEFPEVFIDLERADWQQNPGFDAVVGNPPYVRQEELRGLKPYFKAAFPNVYAGTADLFVYFFAQALALLQEGGRTSYISSNSWLRANYATALRRYLREETTVESLIDLGDNRVFEDAPDLYPAIHIAVSKSPSGTKEQVAGTVVFDRGEGIQETNFEEQLSRKEFKVSIHNQHDEGWQLEDEESRKVLQKISDRASTNLGSYLDGRIFFGVKTGLNAAFIIDDFTRNQIVDESPETEPFIKRVLRGASLRPWYQEDEGSWIIVLPSGWTKEKFGTSVSEEEAWNGVKKNYPALAKYLEPFARRAKKRQDQGDFWWELRPCVYYHAFEETKILWPDISKYPRFSMDKTGLYLTNTGYIAHTNQEWLLAYLMSRCAWFTVSLTSIVLGERAGLNRYRLFQQYMFPLPIPEPDGKEKEMLASIATMASDRAELRYKLHTGTRQRILTDWAGGNKKLGNKLTAWWELDFPTFRAEIKSRFKRDIPVAERDEWQAWLAAQRAEHDRLTAEIIRLETDLNARVYALFDLTPDEIQIIEESTKYPYGAV